MRNQQATLPIFSIAQIRKNAKFRLTLMACTVSALLTIIAVIFLDYLLICIPAFCLAAILIERTIRIRKQLCAMDINGDALIISSKQTSTITDIKSIRRIRSTKIGGQKLTSVDFKLDGTNRSVILMSSSEESPGRVLSDLKKKKKADL